MMLRRVWINIGLGKFFLLFGVSLLFGLGERMSAQGSLPLHLLAILNDQYYFIFAVLPIVLLFCTGVIEDDTLLVLMRYGTYRRYFFHKWRALSVAAAMQKVGLDPEDKTKVDYKTYNDIKEIIRILQAEGRTILMTSHNYDDLETLCTQIYAIDEGELSALSGEEMKKRFHG